MQHDLPNVAQLSTRLADDNARVARFIDRMAQRIDALMAALQQGDVDELRRLSENLASIGDAHGGDTIRYRAERVCEEIRKPNNLRGIRRSVVRLIGACGTGHEDRPDDWQI
jgi:hypothetical protein